MTCIPLHKTWQMNLHWLMDPWEWSIDVWNTAIPNFVDKPTLANGPPGTRAEMTCIPLHTTWQMSLLWPMDPPSTRHDLHTTTQNLADDPTLAEPNGKGLKALAFTISEIPTTFSQNTFSLANDFLSFVGPQKSLLVSFQGC